MLERVDLIRAEIFSGNLEECAALSSLLRTEKLGSNLDYLQRGQIDTKEAIKALGDLLATLTLRKTGREIRSNTVRTLALRIQQGTPIHTVITDQQPALITPEMRSEKGKKGGILPEIILMTLIKAAQKIFESDSTISPEEIERANSLLRLAGLMERIPYDKLYEDRAYLFMTREEANVFALEQVANFGNGTNTPGAAVKEKRILTVGHGYGSDELKLAELEAERVIPIDDSPVAREMFQKRIAALPRNRRRDHALRAIRFPRKLDGIFSTLEDMRACGETVDTIYAHSSLHYYDDNDFQALLSLIFSVLATEEEGRGLSHLCFAVKLPGAPLDREGVHLFEKTSLEKTEEGGEKITTSKSIRENTDGQMRVFRDQATILAQIEKLNRDVVSTGYEFSCRLSATRTIRDYDVPGEQEFGFFILEKRPIKQA